MRKCLAPAIAVLAVFIATTVMAADIYVSIDRGKNKRGDGTTDKPYKNIEWAIDKANPGDVIHIAEGHYPGIAGRGHWEVNKGGLTFLAGYTDDFSERDPFTHITLLAWDDSEENRTRRAAGPDFLAIEDENRKPIPGITIDGFTMDGGPRNEYRADPENPSMKTDSTPNDVLLRILVAEGSEAVIRNCTFLNPGECACMIVQAMPGSSVQLANNVFCNSVYHQLDVGTKQQRSLERADFDIFNNTFVFSWRSTENGSGVYVRPYSNVKVRNNILAWGDAWALCNTFYEKKVNERGVPIATGLANENVEFDNNLVHMWKRGIYGWVMEGQTGILSTSDLEELWDTSLASAENIEVGEPGFEYNKEWMNHYLSRGDAAEGEVPQDAISKLRGTLGLAIQVPPNANRQGYCMRYPLADIMKFRQASSTSAEGRGATMQVMGPGAEPTAAGPTKEEQIQQIKAQIEALQKKLEELMNE